MATNRESRTIAEQIALLKSRRMLIEDEQTAALCLEHISYFRLKGYWWDMQIDKANHIFAPNSYFEDVVARYNFDRQLRLILETATFGLLSKFFKNLKHQLPQKAMITNDFGLNLQNELSSWLETITYLRNIIAHHSRIWGRSMVKRITLPKITRNLWLKPATISIQESIQRPKPFLAISTMVYLCNAINPNNEIKNKLLALFQNNPNIPISKLGFFNNWQNEPLWK